MANDFEKIEVFAAGVTERRVPFDYGNDISSLHVWAIVDGVRIQLDQGVDWAIDVNDVLTIDDEYKDHKIMVACVPCPEISLPKFGAIENEVLESGFNNLRTYANYLEFLIGRSVEVPYCPDDGCYLPVIDNGSLKWMKAEEIADKFIGILQAVDDVEETEPELQEVWLNWNSPRLVQEKLGPVCIPETKPSPAMICQFKKSVNGYDRFSTLIPVEDL